MAIPSLQQQIEFVDTIIVMKAVSADGQRRYKIDEILKSRYDNAVQGEFVRADFSIFEILGYKVADDQQVIAMLAARKNLSDYDCIDFLPVNNNRIVYGKDDDTVREEITLDDLRAAVQNIQ